MRYHRNLPKFFILIILLIVTALPNLIYAAPGDLDLTFGMGGEVLTSIGNQSSDHAYAVAQQADGRILVAGDTYGDNGDLSQSESAFVVSRINTDGSLDRSFGFNGTATKRMSRVSFRLNALTVQPDGKILGGGFALINNPELNSTVFHFFLVRMNADGSIDNSFGTNGIVTTQIAELTANSVITSIALQADGKIVAAGYVGSSGRFAIARFNADGTLDATFDSDGKLSFIIGSVGVNRANAVAIQSDGKIVLGGYTRLSAGQTSDFALVRLNSDGSFDTTFDGDGKLTTQIGTNGSQLNALKIQADGKIIAAGLTVNPPTQNTAIARYNINGSLDTTFDADGILTFTQPASTVRSIALNDNGKITVGGGTINPYDFFSLRLNADGSRDNTYNGNGLVITLPTPLADISAGMILQSDGKVVIAGYNDRLFTARIALSRTNADGSIDTTFDGDGTTVIELGNARDIIFKTAVQPDGKIVACGYSFDGLQQNISLARYMPNGSLDLTFGNQGKVVTALTDSNTQASDLAIQPDGKIVVAAAPLTTATTFLAIRYNADGSLDSSFGTAGILSFTVGNEYSYRLVLQPDGKIILAGNSASLARLNPNGSLDSSFGNGGIVLNNNVGNSFSMRSAALQNDGKIVVAGYNQFNTPTFGYRFFVNRYNSNGSLDTTFGGTGTVYSAVTNYDIGSAVKIQTDGKIVVAGYGTDNYILVRFNTDGSLDTTFDGDGKVTTFISTNYYSQLTDLAIQQNGKLVVVGYAESPPGINATVFRYNPNGSLDSSFGSGGKIVQSVGDTTSIFYSATIQNDGKILAGGFGSNGANDDFLLIRYQGETANLRTPFDFDGDGKADISVFRPSNGSWYIQQSQNGFTGAAFGLSTDKIVPADYDGDGKTDFAVFRDGVWYLQRSSLGFTGIAFGAADDIPVPADFDADGRADVAVFRPSNGTWYLLRSQLGFAGIAFGQIGDKPVAADFDGDGKADISVYRNGTWYLQRSLLGFTGIEFGAANDKPVQADYDGDGRADVAVYRDGTWYVQRSQLGFTGVTFGDAADLPVPADYDGDGKTDVAVFRPVTGTWYLLRSQSGFTGNAFGSNNDKPIPNAFVY